MTGNYYRADSNSPNPAVQGLVAQLVSRGQRLEYATVDDTGRVIGYKPVGQQLIIVPPPRNSTPQEVAGVPGLLDYAGQMQRDFTASQLFDFANLRGARDNRVLYFSLGIGVLMMVLIYSRKRR